MQTEPLGIPDVTLIAPKVQRDERGSFCETWNRRVFEQAGIAADFVQDNHAYSRRRGTLIPRSSTR